MDSVAYSRLIALHSRYRQNSASCIGVEGVSDAFTSAIWGVNAAMQMAYRNHSNMLLHTSGQSTIYNLFTSPAYNSTTTAWVTGPIFYSLLVVAEALGSSNASTVKDLQVNSNVISAYGVYENGVAQRVVLLNQVNDPSGNNVLRAQIPSNGTKSVQVKYLLAPSIEEKANIVSTPSMISATSRAFTEFPPSSHRITEYRPGQTKHLATTPTVPCKAPSKS